MEIFVQVLLWLHLVALSMGGAASFGLPVVGSKLPTASDETRPVLFSIAKGLSSVSRAALVILIITGPLLFWLGWNFTAPNMVFFGIKMVLVVVLLAGVIYAGTLMKRAQSGDRAAAQMRPRLGAGITLTLILIILTAVLAFD